MSSSTDSSFWKEQARDTRPGNAANTSPRMSSAGMDSQSRSGSWGRLSTEQHLLQRVAAQPEAERLERNHLVGRDVAEIDVGTEVLHEPRLARLRRRLEDQFRDRYLVRDLVDEPRA